MPPRLKRLIGTVFIAVFVLVYALIAARIGDGLSLRLPLWAMFIYFAIAGLLWTVPVGGLIWWMYGKRKA